MSLSNVELCSAALVKLGAVSISSFDEGTTEADVAKTLYDIVRDGLFGSHPWSFATAHVELIRLPAPPVTDFDYAFELPTDFIKALSAGDEERGRGLVYQIVGRELHANYENVTLAYIRRADEADFPAYFISALINRLAAEFCLPLTENTSRSDLLFKLANTELRLAKLIDSQQDTPPRVEDFTLIEARTA